MRKLASACAIAAITVLLLEAALRIWNPIPFRLRGDRIDLRPGMRYVIHNPDDPKLDRVVTQVRNEFGFRGPDVPADFASRLSIVTIGGSTTECLVLPDDAAWPAVMAADLSRTFPNVWVNNAGVDGETTIGHMTMLNSRIVPLHPTVVLFLTGINDVGMSPAWASMFGKGWRAAARHSEVASTALNLVRIWRARPVSYDINDGTLDVRAARHLDVAQQQIDALIVSHRKFIDAYRSRLSALIDRSEGSGIRPVLITQPLLAGDAIDPSTGVDLARIVDEDHPFENGATTWQLLERYNDQARELAKTKGVTLIDLARLLPKDSRLFIDFVHFSNDGSREVGHIVARELAARFKEGDGI